MQKNKRLATHLLVGTEVSSGDTFNLPFVGSNVATIYLSSTYTDLKVCRESVYRALRQMRHDVIAMEDYVATDQRPTEKCLADVAAADLYIGIFAWRYGYIPREINPDHKSITELEYRQAQQTGRSCL